MRKLKNKTVLADLPPLEPGVHSSTDQFLFTCSYSLAPCFAALLGSWSTIVFKVAKYPSKPEILFSPQHICQSCHCGRLSIARGALCLIWMELLLVVFGRIFVVWAEMWLHWSICCISMNLTLRCLPCIVWYSICIHILLKTETLSARTIRGPGNPGPGSWECEWQGAWR